MYHQIKKFKGVKCGDLAGQVVECMLVHFENWVNN